MSKTILLADDSVTIQKVVELTFLEEDYDVVAVSSGHDALERLEELDPALVIADVHMPGADGFEVCRRVKEGRPELPVLLLVGAFESFDPESVEACGAQGFLKKPFDSHELQRLALELIGGGEGAAGGERQGEEAAERRAPAASAGGAEPRPAVAAGGRQRRSDEPEAGGEWPAWGGAQERPAGPRGDAVEAVPPEPAAEEASPEAAASPAPAGAEPASPEGGGARPESVPGLSEDQIERIARRVVELLSDEAVRDVAWEVVPELAEVVIRERLRELESQVD